MPKKTIPESSEKVEQLSTFARNTLHELRRTVWFINKDSVNLEELQLKLKEYFNFLNQSPNLTITTLLEAEPSQVIPSPKAAAIFRVAQEGRKQCDQARGRTSHQYLFNLTGTKYPPASDRR
ncbi:MAG: hypothetical protein WDN75_18745 [Bacteroidota bacterium]